MAAALNVNLYLLAINFLCTFPFLIPLSESQIAPSTQDDPAGNQSQNHTSTICDHTIFSFLPHGYRNQRGFLCSHAGGSVYFKFLQNKDNVTTVFLSREKFSGWMGFGFSKDGGMVGSIAVVGWTGGELIDEHMHKVEVKPGIAKFFLQGKDNGSVISFKGDEFMNFTDNPPFVITNDDLFYMGFQVKFDAPLAQQYVILAVGTDQPSIDGNSSKVSLTKHINQAVMQVDFSSGYGESGTDGQGLQKVRHGMVGLVGWGAVLPFGAIIPRYLRGKGGPQWFFLHISFQIVGFLLALSTVFLGGQLYNELLPEHRSSVKAHRPIGIVAFSLTILQVLALVIRPHKTSEWRKYWNWYHRWVGRLALFLGSTNIVIGLSIGEAGPPWKIGFGFLSTFLLLTVACLESSPGLPRSRKSETASVLGND